MRFKSTGIWQRAFAPRADDPHADQRQRLATSYESFWDNACALSAQISKELPSLTLHDERHFEALWERADQIAGPDYKLNPLETFILGGAILLHDLGHALAAYPDGVENLKKTPEWRDAATEAAEFQPDSDRAEDGKQSYILFSTLRRLHARRAESLGLIHFKNLATNQEVHLIHDDSLRTHLSRTIGLIAASHHWDISELERRLPPLVGALSKMPVSWQVQSVKIACLLRCSDAVQIDQSRTPDFLYALLNLRGISESHWRAQNRITAPTVDPNDLTALIFSSTMAFEEVDASAWWIAYDAIQIADQELSSSKTLLRSLNQQEFQIERVKDADSPHRLTKHLPTSGWHPVSAEIKISNISHVVSMFGGSEIYGGQNWVPIRELIQNSVDAVAMRREAEPHNRAYTGRVTVRLQDLDDGLYRLEFEDDGIGMSQAALTGPLIDFGSSYWGSELSKVERPGLLKASHNRIGKYGIGFFSSFMIASKVEVISRPFDSGLSEFKTLRFSGLENLRPILLDHATASVSAFTSTKICLTLDSASLKKMLTLENISDDEGGTLTTLREIISCICVAVDCDIYYDDGENCSLLHGRDWTEENAREWLSRISAHENWDASVIERLHYIDPARRELGRAAINLGHGSFGLECIGGLRATKLYGNFHLGSEDYVGFMSIEADGPQRSSGPLIGRETLPAWASHQALELHSQRHSASELRNAAPRIAAYGGNPEPICSTMLNRQHVFNSEILKLINNGEAVYAPIAEYYSSGRSLNYRIGQILEKFGRISSIEVDFQCHTLEFERHQPAFSSYFFVPMNFIFPENSYLWCLDRLFEKEGLEVNYNITKDHQFATYNGRESARDNITKGMPITSNALVISAKY